MEGHLIAQEERYDTRSRAYSAWWRARTRPWRARLTEIQDEAQVIYGRYQQALVRLRAQ